MRQPTLLLGLVTATIAATVKRQALLGSVVGAAEVLFSGERPEVQLDYADYQGVKNHVTGTNDFLGMRFGTANRLEEAKFIDPATKPKDIQDASKYGNACPQVQLAGNPLNFGAADVAETLTFIQQIAAPPGLVQGQSEDCLFANVQVSNLGHLYRGYKYLTVETGPRRCQEG